MLTKRTISYACLVQALRVGTVVAGGRHSLVPAHAQSTQKSLVVQRKEVSQLSKNIRN